MSPKPHAKDNRCRFTSSAGRRCRLLRAEGHSSLCLQHWRREQDVRIEEHEKPEAIALVAELLGACDKLRTKTAVNDAIAKLFSLRSRKFISVRDTAVLGFLLQLSLQTLEGVDYEFNRIHNSDVWTQIIAQSIRDACGPDAPELQSEVAVAPTRKRKRGRGSCAPDARAERGSRAPDASVQRPRRRRSKMPATAKEFAAMVLDQAVKDGVITQEFLDREERRRQPVHSEDENAQGNETDQENQECVAPEESDPPFATAPTGGSR